MEMDNRRMDNILLICLQGKAEEAEYEHAYNWIMQSEENCYYYEQLRDAWIATGVLNQQNKFDQSVAWRKVIRKTGIKPAFVTLLSSKFVKVAACYLIAFISGALISYILYNHINEREIVADNSIFIEAPRGSKAFVILADSTKVWLNAGSRLSYNSGYFINQRDVHLEGEAYFEITPNKNLPFKVHALGIVVEALGTSFNVKAYPDDPFVETTLISGLARIERSVGEGMIDEVILKPNQKVSFENSFRRGGDSQEKRSMVDNSNIAIASKEPEIESKKIKIEQVEDSKEITSWREKRLYFRRERMADLAVKLERVYDVDIIFLSEELKNYNLTVTLEEETLEQILAAIRLTIPMDFKVKGSIVELSMNEALRAKYVKLLN